MSNGKFYKQLYLYDLHARRAFTVYHCKYGLLRFGFLYNFAAQRTLRHTRIHNPMRRLSVSFGYSSGHTHSKICFFFPLALRGHSRIRVMYSRLTASIPSFFSIIIPPSPTSLIVPFTVESIPVTV